MRSIREAKASGFTTVILIFVIIAFSSCYSYEPRLGPEPVYGRRSDLSRDRSDGRTVIRYPWEIWPHARTLGGLPLKNITIIKGDEYLSRGDREKALEEYITAYRQRLNPMERESIVARVAGTELALGNPDRAMKVLTRYFDVTAQRVEEVNGILSLILAYVYGANNDVEQSLAWFSRVNSVDGARGGLSEAADTGVRMLLQSLPDGQLENLPARWKDDMFISFLMGRENFRRSNGGKATLARPFYADSLTTAINVVPVEGGALPGTVRVGVLLPLSGRYENFGTAIRNGIELAKLGFDQPEAIEFVYRDTAGDDIQAVAQSRELLSGDTRFIIGPLVGTAADAVGEVAVSNNIPMMALSKSSSLRTGGNVFRLAVTTEAQIRSLLTAAIDQMGMRNIAIVFPDNASGREYAEVFRRQLADRGLSPAYEVSYSSPDASIFLTIGDELDRQPVDAVLFPDSVLSATKFMQTIGSGRRKSFALLGTAKWDDQREIQRSRKVLEGSYYVSPFFQESEDAEVAKFVEAYRNQYGSSPDFMAAQGFDAATLVENALIRQQQSQEPLAQALRGLPEYDGLTGKLHAGFDGELTEQLTLVQITGRGPVRKESGDVPEFRMRSGVEY